MRAPALIPAAAALAVSALTALPAFADDTPAARNTRHALLIGVGEYLSPEVPPLAGVVHDMASARRIAHAMSVPDENVTVLRDRDATAERIRAEIDALAARVHDGDRVFVYYSGHGTRWQDGSAGGECTEGLLAADGRVLSNHEVGAKLAPIARHADKMLVFYDACFSGGVAGAPFRTRALDLRGERITPKFSAAGAAAACSQPSNFKTRSLALVMQQRQSLPETVVHVAASRPDEVSFDSASQGGFATTAWRDCLLGQAKDLDGSGAVTVDEVTRCAQARVTTALAGQPGILGQHMVVHGNAGFVPAWMSAEFASAPAAPAAPVAVTATPVAAPVAPAPARIATPAEILAELHGQRDGHRPVEARLRRPVLTIGRDALELEVTPSRDGWLYVALAGADGHSLHLLYPNELARDNRVQAGRTLQLPGPGWEVVAGGPAGTETLLVMLTDAPRDLSSLPQAQDGPFVRTLLDAEGRARLQQILADGTPAPGCGRPGAPGCSDAFGAALLTLQTQP